MTVKIDRAANDAIRAREDMLKMHGGSVPATDIAHDLGVRRQLIEAHRAAGKVLGLRVGRYNLYPRWQFGLKGVDVALMALKDFDPWMQLAFFVQPKDSLDGKTPIDCLRGGDIERVIQAAKIYREQGAR